MSANATTRRSARRLAASAALCAALGGCGAAETLGIDEYVPRKTVVYDKPVTNSASRVEPFVQRLRYPMPDRSWERENGSEVDPWTLLGR